MITTNGKQDKTIIYLIILDNLHINFILTTFVKPKTNIMNDLVEYQRQRIEALERKLFDLQEDYDDLQEEYNELLIFKTKTK